MDILIGFLGVSLAISVGVAWFFGSEYRKKTGFALAFFNHSSKLLTRYEYPGAQKQGLKPGMYNFALRSDRPFETMAGIDITIPLLGRGFDPIGVGTSHMNELGQHEIVHRTYLGNGPVIFVWVHNSGMPVTVTLLANEDDRLPTIHTPPHWFQKLGFFS